MCRNELSNEKVIRDATISGNVLPVREFCGGVPLVANEPLPGISSQLIRKVSRPPVSRRY